MKLALMVRSNVTDPLLFVNIVTNKLEGNAISNPLLQWHFVDAADIIDSLQSVGVAGGDVQLVEGVYTCRSDLLT